MMINVAPSQLGDKIKELEKRLNGCLKARQDAEQAHREGIFARKTTCEEASGKLKAAHQAANEEHRKHFTLERERLATRLRNRTGRVNNAFNKLQEPLNRKRRELVEQCRNELKEAQDRYVEEEQQTWADLSRQHDQTMSEITSLHAKAKRIRLGVENLAGALGVQLDEEGEAAPASGEADESHVFLERMNGHYAKMAVAYHGLRVGFGATLARRSWTFMAYLFVAVAHVVALFLIIQSKRPPVEFYAYLGGSLTVSGLLVYFLTRAMRHRTIERLLKLCGEVRAAECEALRQEKVEKDRHWAQYGVLIDKRIERSTIAEQKINQAAQARKDELEQLGANLKMKYERIREYVRQADQKARQTYNEDLARTARQLGEAQEAEWNGLNAKHAAWKENSDRQKDETLKTAAAQWSEDLKGFTEFGQYALASSEERRRSWESMFEGDAKLTVVFPESIMVGKIELPLQKLDVPAPEGEALCLPKDLLGLPASLLFPGTGSLLIHADGGVREEAVQILFNTALRILVEFPPGMARLTVVDPVGLGQDYSALMQLADHDETLIGGRIWTESGHIEKRLSELTEHMEIVIQKYLRNRYTSIGEYNIMAGEMKEPYQFLVISDFPSGISDLAMERLASIISSGAPCGVHVLIFHDTRQSWPKLIDVSQLRRDGLVLKKTPEGFVPDHEGLARARFVPERAPEVLKITPLLDIIGRQALEAKRVELSFHTVAPPEGELWIRSTERDICVPIGRSGAVKLQEITLGKGTAQHALIAGRTGSGKSTLFHVLITNLALWFSPEEIEFYLIDFKKGVEFKAYANHRLPHARVIAIESDREFGVAVLKRLDEELTRRGELFRNAGVQDLASYRKLPGAKVMPRTLLLIDEFQEYFTEDDAPSQEASLLLDRFVRQGRAFGVHVILGSQTLSGVFTLAKSTLGQMGVRIALQCNESDSYLILSEDNAAARLLSRPGEAIYNDMSGLVEGNNPFQIVWLPDEVQAGLLKRIAGKADAEQRWPEQETIVFEGNAPARLEKNVLLKRCLERGLAEHDPLQRVWLGDPNAIKGPTEAVFAANGGSHLLILGQRKDAAFGMMNASILSLAARMPMAQLRILVLDGSGSDQQFTDQFVRLSSMIPHAYEMVDYREIPERIAGLDKAIKDAQEAGVAPDEHTFVFVFGLQRFRALRQEDDFSMSLDKDAGGNTGEQFGTIIKEGPEQRIHLVVWCDTLANANRAINRRMMHEFDQRVLFQMSAADSSDLIDSPAANNLGLHNALLYVESSGSMEKFRPYAVPDEAWQKTVQMALHARFQAPVKSEGV